MEGKFRFVCHSSSPTDVSFDPHPWVAPPLQPGVLGSMTSTLTQLGCNQHVRIIASLDQAGVSVALRAKVIPGSSEIPGGDTPAIRLTQSDGQGVNYADGIVFPFELPTSGVIVAPVHFNKIYL